MRWNSISPPMYESMLIPQQRPMNETIGAKADGIGGRNMNPATARALGNAAASSAMEGLPLEQADIEVVKKILDGEMSLQDFIQTLTKQDQEQQNELPTHEQRHSDSPVPVREK